MSKNAFIDFLATYGPTPSASSMYDEHVLQGAAQRGTRPISVETDRVGHIIESLTGSEPCSVVLTGTAGDGKTWHCRTAFIQLGGTEYEWSQSECRVERGLPNGRRLVIVKDLSQLEGKPEQDEVIAGLFDSAYGNGEDVYLVAANDGQMLRALRRYADSNPSGKKAEEAIRTMLKNDRSSTAGLRLNMWNLSRQSHDESFEKLLDAVIGHEGWTGCGSCEAVVGCPIQRNRAILREGGTVGLHARLRDAIRIAADNDMHLPIRHVLLLIVNTLLGVTGMRAPLMSCADAESLAREGRLEAANPYDNVVGRNLGPDAQNYRAFVILAAFGIGRETNNLIDGLLIDGEPEREHAAYVADGSVFGASLFDDLRRQYRRGEVVDFDEFREAIEQQRRRLFFRLPPAGPASQNELDPWRLTVFTHAGEYLAFAQRLRAGAMDMRIRNRLAIGLNRSYTGMMCDEGTQLWFAAPAANAQSRIGQVLDIRMPVGEDPMVRVYFDVDAGGVQGGVRMVVREGQQIVESNALQPLLFEYLLRVEGGSLPGSFSRQCFEELRQFRLRVVAALSRRRLIDADGIGGIRIVSLSGDGRLHADEIGLTTARGQ
jgi:hypothetical protein